jgi:caffeoyl-CoA O-methyltransferase
MSSSLGLTPDLVRYLVDVNPPEHPVLVRCRENTARLPQAQMQISAEQGAFMQMLARMISARHAFEVGVFTGYSSLAIALVLHEMHGRAATLLACDINADWTAKAREYWREAGVDGIIDLNLASGVETLDRRLRANEVGHYDFGFIDADKTSYDAYYERGLKMLRPGGIMLFDNMLWNGAVADPADQSPDTIALRALALKAKADTRVHAAMTSIGDGLLIMAKR